MTMIAIIIAISITLIIVGITSEFAVLSIFGLPAKESTLDQIFLANDWKKAKYANEMVFSVNEHGLPDRYFIASIRNSLICKYYIYDIKNERYYAIPKWSGWHRNNFIKNLLYEK